MKAELFHAWAWICDECGRRNYADSIAIECSPEEFEARKIELGIEDNLEGCFFGLPDRVVCPHCQAEYEAEAD